MDEIDHLLEVVASSNLLDFVTSFSRPQDSEPFEQERVLTGVLFVTELAEESASERRDASDGISRLGQRDVLSSEATERQSVERVPRCCGEMPSVSRPATTSAGSVFRPFLLRLLFDNTPPFAHAILTLKDEQGTEVE